jgi:thymidylate kinase
MKILETLRPLKTHDTVVYERSLLSSRWVFLEVLKKQGIVTEGEDATYATFYDKFVWYPDIYIFLSKTPDLAWTHIQDRHQAGDSGVTLEYWKELDIEYKNLLSKVPCRVYVINANRSVEEIHKEISTIISGNELLRSDTERDEVQTKGNRGREVSCTPFPNLCRVS